MQGSRKLLQRVILRKSKYNEGDQNVNSIFFLFRLLFSFRVLKAVQ